ncbi:MAG: YceD family protein [Coriobacteriia bacterium]|nr:YceD family protein [Coriobacteriia bacterium]
MDAYLIDVGDITHDLGATVHFADVIDLAGIEYGGIEFSFPEPPRVDVTVTNTGAGLVAMGSVTALVSTECTRCLEPFTFPLQATVEGFFTTPGKAQSLPDDQDWDPVVDDGVDLLPSILAAIRIELPFAPVHDESCAGICPQCGCDRNSTTCMCDPENDDDGPFAALRTLLPEDSEEA